MSSGSGCSSTAWKSGTRFHMCPLKKPGKGGRSPFRCPGSSALHTAINPWGQPGYPDFEGISGNEARVTTVFS